MRQELQEQIWAAAPKLFKPGFAVGDIDHLSARHQKRLLSPAYISVGDGWFKLIMDLSTKLESMDGVEDVRISQIKEKFGTLRFYVDSATEEMYKVIEEVEDSSAYICEECGEVGKLYKDRGWLTVACEEHRGEGFPIKEDV